MMAKGSRLFMFVLLGLFKKICIGLDVDLSSDERRLHLLGLLFMGSYPIPSRI